MSTLALALVFGGRDFRIARTYRFAFAMTVASTVMSLVTFRFISEMVGDAKAVQATGDYFAFVVVGIVLSHILEGALSGPSAAVRQEQIQGTLEVLAAQPLSPAQLGSGFASYPVLHSVLGGVLTLGIGGMLGLRLDDPSWAAALIVIALSAVVFAALGILASAVVLVFQQGGGLTTWIASALAIASGVFFPLTLLPGWMQALASLSPLTPALRALRGALLHGHGIAAIGGDLIALACAAAVLVPASLIAFSRALRFARARGTISTY